MSEKQVQKGKEEGTNQPESKTQPGRSEILNRAGDNGPGDRFLEKAKPLTEGPTKKEPTDDPLKILAADEEDTFWRTQAMKAVEKKSPSAFMTGEGP